MIIKTNENKERKQSKKSTCASVKDYLWMKRSFLDAILMLFWCSFDALTFQSALFLLLRYDRVLFRQTHTHIHTHKTIDTNIHKYISWNLFFLFSPTFFDLFFEDLKKSISIIYVWKKKIQHAKIIIIIYSL